MMRFLAALCQRGSGITMLKAVLPLLMLACAFGATPAKAQMPEGTVGWSGPPGTRYTTAYAACQAWYYWSGPNTNTRFIGDVTYNNNADPNTRGCSWTNHAYLCPDEHPGGAGCFMPNPSLTFFVCSSGYVRTATGFCEKGVDLTPQRPCNCRNGGSQDPPVGNPIFPSTGAKTASATDFATEDGLFSIGRKYRSLPVGRTVSFRQMPRGLASNWTFDFAYELQLGSFSGSPSSPSAKLALVAPDGTSYDFVMQSGGALAVDTTTGAYYAPTDLKLEYVGTLPTDLADVRTATSTWRVTDGDDTVWEFQTFPPPNSADYWIGRPTSRTSREGYAWTLAYAGDTSLTSITDSFGRVATFSWYQFYTTSLATPPSGVPGPYPEAVASIALPDGTSLRYSYDPTPATSAPSFSEIQRLIKVERLSAASAVVDSTTYLYEDATRFPKHLTGIKDNRNVRIATYAYDARGRGISTEGGDGADHYDVAYVNGVSATTATVTGPLGKVGTYTYSRFGSGLPDIRITSVVEQASTYSPAISTSVTYDGNAFIATQVDGEGRTTATTRDAKGRPTTIVEAQGTAIARTTTITWDSTLNLPLTTVKPGVTETRTYNGAGQLATRTLTDTTSITVPYSTNGRTHTWTYDWSANGLLESVDGPLSGTGDTVSFSYTPAGYLATRTDEVGHVTTITSHDGRGAPLTIEDENGIDTVMTYDGVGRPLTVTIDPGPSQSQYTMTYDAAGNLDRLTVPGGGWLEYTYDDASRVTSIENDRSETQTFTLNDFGQPTASVTKNASAVITQQQANAYDELGRVLQTIGAGSQTWSYAYDKVDNLTRTTDARSKDWFQGWDPLDRMITQTDPETAQVGYTYDPNDSLKQFRDGRSLVTNRVIDGFGLTIQEQSPDRGTITYWYDAADRLTKKVDAKGQETLYTYDNAGRQLTETYTGTTAENIAYTYDATAGGNKGVGRLTGVTDASGATAFSYDAQGRLITDAKTIGALSYNVAYGYDANGQVTSITYPSGHIVTYTRASDGKVTAVSAKPSALGSSTNIATSVAYAPFGPLTDLTYGNGLVLERGFDQNYWQNALVVSAPGVDRLDLQYTRNANGDLTGVTDNIASGRAATYGYSDASRLASADGAWGDNGYSWDKAGNRQATSGAGSPGYREAAGYENGSNRLALLSVEGGPLPADPLYAAGDTYAYAYGARQRLLTLKLNGSDIASYQYDHAGQRVSATQLSGTPSTSHFVFAPDGRLLAEHDGASGTMLREYIWLDDMPLALVTGSVATPTYSYVHTGQIGEPLMVTDASKAKVWDAAVDPWGRPTMLATATQDLKLRLPGQWYQSESGLHQNWMRDYDPVLGRYIEADPLGIEAGQNLFGYVDGRPLSAKDPRGLQGTIRIPRPWWWFPVPWYPEPLKIKKPPEDYTPSKEKSYKEQCSECKATKPRLVAQAEAQEKAGFYQHDKWVKRIEWDQYSQLGHKTNPRALNEFKRDHSGQPFGYEWDGAWVEEHAIGHPGDPSQPWHQCPHFHWQDRYGETGIVAYKPES